MREQKVIVAIVEDSAAGFLVTFNEKWGGYAFPMIALPDDGEIFGSLAIKAVEHDLGLGLPKATAKELCYMSHVGVSERTGEETLYHYWLFTVEQGQTLDLSTAVTASSNPPLFLLYVQLISRTDLTWSTPAIAQDFVKDQDAILAVVTRAGEHETEFLLVWNDSYDGYFFPTQRVKSEVKPEGFAKGTIRHDLGYFGPVNPPIHRGKVLDVHFSNRFFFNRTFSFHVCEIQLPDVDLHQPGGVLEQAMLRRGKKFLWLPGSKLNAQTIPFSPTMSAVRSYVLKVIPQYTFAGPLRRSEGGIALIQRTVGGKREWLAQWNDNWEAFFFIGGHREGNETFRECVIREIEEELGLTPTECPVAPAGASHLEYRAVSRSAGELTEYVMELFCAQPTPDGLQEISANSKNKWLDENEIRGMQTHDYRSVSVSMKVILDLAK